MSGRWKHKPQHKGVMVRPADNAENRAKLAQQIESIRSKINTVFDTMTEVYDLKASRLYMITGKPWEQFVEDEFQFSRQWADELIAARDGMLYIQSEAANTSQTNPQLGCGISPSLPPILTNVKDLAAVGRLAQKKGKDVNAVLRKAKESGKVTHKTIKTAHAEIERAKKTRKAEKEAAAAPIPAKVAKAIDVGKAVRQIVKDARALCKRLDGFAETPYAVHLSAGQHTDIIRRALEHFKVAAPYADCVHCGGHSDCKKCDSLGWLRKVDFDALPAGLKSTSRIVNSESDDDEGDEGVEI